MRVFYNVPMGLVFLFAIAVIFLFSGIRRIPPAHCGLIERLGRQLPGVRQPGTTWIVPTFDRLKLISLDPFQYSLPPQSAITSDEIPLQLQASVLARVRNPEETTTVKDWRTSTVSILQNLMKERLEELDFDRLQTDFPQWVLAVRNELVRRTAVFGVEIQDLQISNLSPRTRPEE